VAGIGRVGEQFDVPRAGDRGPAVIGLAALERLQVEERGEPLVSRPTGPLPARLGQRGHMKLPFGEIESGGRSQRHRPPKPSFQGPVLQYIYGDL
jgi:hypothetical protein